MTRLIISLNWLLIIDEQQKEVFCKEELSSWTWVGRTLTINKMRTSWKLFVGPISFSSLGKSKRYQFEWRQLFIERRHSSSSQPINALKPNSIVLREGRSELERSKKSYLQRPCLKRTEKPRLLKQPILNLVNLEIECEWNRNHLLNTRTCGKSWWNTCRFAQFGGFWVKEDSTTQNHYKNERNSSNRSWLFLTACNSTQRTTRAIGNSQEWKTIEHELKYSSVCLDYQYWSC